ncbi:MAG: hypothetical protein HOM25_13125 [Rhodospirillaceae bacterium]|jgi:hypothetical protein|nr:hypothetical protein [Rhodospirillaceae bacterium]MBT5664724.1 hypothetical protein [Rhodospirillaceae bacterium]MBT5810568.1 hypothetical protein [Rhodospirillaceae bacterium]
MQALFSSDYTILWALVLAAALFLPVRRLIWVLMVRRAQQSTDVDETEQQRLKHRAGVTAALLSFVFSMLYVSTLFGGAS